GNPGYTELFGEGKERFEGAATFGEGLVKETFAVEPEQVEGDINNWYFFAQEEVEFAAAKALLEFGEWEGAIAAHGEEFAVKNEVDWKGFCGVDDVEEGAGDFLQVTGDELDARADFVKLATDAVVLV